MKMPRFFILIGACALVSTIALLTLESNHRPCWADQLVPIMRADPLAGDPDMPGIGRKLPFDEGDTASKSAPYELTSTAPRNEPFTPSLWMRLRTLRFMAVVFGRPW